MLRLRRQLTTDVEGNVLFLRQQDEDLYLISLDPRNKRLYIIGRLPFTSNHIELFLQTPRLLCMSTQSSLELYPMLAYARSASKADSSMWKRTESNGATSDDTTIIDPMKSLKFDGQTPAIRTITTAAGKQGQGRRAIADFCFHPLNERHLVTLTTDCRMEIYDTTVSLSDPYKSYSFQPAGSIEIAQSLAFGTSGWGKMTAYCLTKGGNVYSLSPVIPASFNCTLIDRDSLVSDVEEFMRSSQTDPLIKEQYSLQKQFLQDIANNPQQWSNMNTLLRGPYRMAPAPYEIEFDDEACDMISVTLTQSDCAINAMLIAYKSGKIDLCMLDSSEFNGASWEIDPTLPDGRLIPEIETLSEGERELLYPEMLVLETIETGLTVQESGVFLIPDKLYPDTVHCVSNEGIISITLESVLCNTLKSISDPNAPNLNIFANVCPVRVAIPSGCNISGAVACLGDEAESLLWVLFSDGTLASVCVNNYRATSVRAQSTVKDDGRSNYSRSSLSCYPLEKMSPIFQRSAGGDVVVEPIILESVGKGVRPNSAKYPTMEWEPKLLEQFLNESNSILKNAALLRNLLAQMDNRVHLFQKETKGQSEEMETARSILTQSETASDEIRKRISDCHERQNSIQKRTDVLLCMAMELYHPSLSRFEEQWIQECKQTAKLVKALVQRATQIKDEADSMIFSSKLQLAPAAETTGGHQTQRLSEWLNQASTFISSIKSKFLMLEAQIEGFHN